MQDLEFRQLIERLKLRSPIEVIVGERVGELKKKGALYQARCPFHEERTPSFTVDPRRGTWHCWGACGEGGDVISFIERFDGLSFLDAVRMLAQQAGEELPDSLFRKRSGADQKRVDERYDVLERAGKLYQRSLASDEGAAARAYAEGRGLRAETLAVFGVGWAPRDGNPLFDAARSAGVKPELLIETGLVKRSDEGRTYDFFRGRWMVPIRDRIGRIVGFGGRILPEDARRQEEQGRPVAKYVNSAENVLFHKGRLIYGLDLAVESVRKSKHLVLVEGYTDVMAAYQAGHRNVAAVLGTATTEDHAALVRRSGANRVSLVFDGDEAGRRATRRALAGLLPLGIRLDVATLPAGVDPCDLLLSDGGAERFSALLDDATEWFAWALGELEGASGAELASGVDAVFELLVRLERPVERSARVAEVASALGLPEADVRLQWTRFEERHRAQPSRTRASVDRGGRARGAADDRTLRSTGAASATAHDSRLAAEFERAESAAEAFDDPGLDGPLPAGAPRDPHLERAFEYLIGALLLDNSLISMYRELEPECPAGELATLFRALLDLYDNAGEDEEEVHAGALLSALGDDPARARVARLEALARTAESARALARDQELWLERRRHEKELNQLRAELLRSNETLDGDSEATDEVLRSLHRELRNRRVPAPPSGHDVPSA